MDKKQETVADILAEMRGYEWGDPAFDRWALKWALKAARGLAREWAARLESALKRELAETEAFALEAGAVVEASRRKPAGNAAAMREALIQCELFLGYVDRHGHPTLNPGDKCVACEGASELRDMVNRALSKPPRNCDIGTPEEQAERFADFCEARTCAECPANPKLWNYEVPCSFIWWNKLPYDAVAEGGAK